MTAPKTPTSQRGTDRRAIWQPRETSVAESVAQYSRFVSVMKVALPGAAGLLLLLIILLPLLRQEDQRFRIGAGLSKNNESGLSMTNARYYGTDNKGQPFNITASGVQQRSGDDRNMALNAPRAEITLNSGTWMSASATSGVYDRDKQ